MAMILWGTLDAASDQTMAAVTRRAGSEFRAALTELIQNVAAGIIANDPTIIEAAEAAVAQALADAHVVTTKTVTQSTIDFRDANGMPVLTVENVAGRPRLKGSMAPDAEYIPGDTIEVVDRNGMVVWRGLGSSDSTSGAFRETHMIPIMGQSNACGVLASPIAPGTNDPVPNLFAVSGTGATALFKAVDPLPFPFATYPGTRGFAVAFARRYALENPDVRVVLVPTAVSGSGFRYSSVSTHTWAPAREGEAGTINLYRQAINLVTQAAGLVSGPVKVPVILWHQMESDAVGETTAAQYAADLADLIAGCRAEMPGATDAIFLVGQTAWEFRNVRKPGTYAAIDSVLRALPDNTRRTGFAPAPGEGYCNPDYTHFTGHGQWLLHDAYWTAYESARYNL